MAAVAEGRVLAGGSVAELSEVYPSAMHDKLTPSRVPSKRARREGGAGAGFYIDRDRRPLAGQ